MRQISYAVIFLGFLADLKKKNLLIKEGCLVNELILCPFICPFGDLTAFQCHFPLRRTNSGEWDFWLS
jgi:hypothetical protein